MFDKVDINVLLEKSYVELESCPIKFKKLDFGSKETICIGNHTANPVSEKYIAIDTKCHIITDLTLVFDLPGFNEQTEYSWVSNVGLALLKYCKLIPKSKMDKVTGKSLLLDADLFLDEGKRALYDVYIGNVPELTMPSCIKKPYRLYIPLTFGRPLKVVTYSSDFLKLRLSPLQKLIQCVDKNAKIPDLHVLSAKVLFKGIYLDSNDPVMRDSYYNTLVSRYTYYARTSRSFEVSQTNHYKKTVNNNTTIYFSKLPIRYLAWEYEYKQSDEKLLVTDISVIIRKIDGTEQTIESDHEMFTSNAEKCQYAISFCNKNNFALISPCKRSGLDSFPGQQLECIILKTKFNDDSKPIIVRMHAKVCNIFRSVAGCSGYAW